MVKAVIFDLDGTLLNTIEDIHAVLCESLVKFNLPQISVKDTQKFVGDGARKLVERAVGVRSDLVEDVYRYYSKKFALCNNDYTRLYDGEHKALTALKEAGIKLAVITNKPQDATNAVVERYLAGFGFNEVLGQTEYYPLKPNPASTLATIKKLDVGIEDCVFVGDGETDVLTARAASIKCISVLWGYRTREQLKAAGANLFVQNFTELLEFIME